MEVRKEDLFAVERKLSQVIQIHVERRDLETVDQATAMWRMIVGSRDDIRKLMQKAGYKGRF